jgi:hypothetical protein
LRERQTPRLRSIFPSRKTHWGFKRSDREEDSGRSGEAPGERVGSPGGRASRYRAPLVGRSRPGGRRRLGGMQAPWEPLLSRRTSTAAASRGRALQPVPGGRRYRASSLPRFRPVASRWSRSARSPLRVSRVCVGGWLSTGVPGSVRHVRSRTATFRRGAPRRS